MASGRGLWGRVEVGAKLGLTRTALGRRLLLAQYRYMFNPEQLWALCDAAGGASQLDGAFVEVGVARGETTVYLHRHLAALGVEPDYYCIDTFDGFTEADVRVERSRGKADPYASFFRANSPKLFRRSMDLHSLSRVKVIQADAGEFDYGTLPPIAFAFVDVDLLRPMSAALEGCWSRLVPGGVMVADDCQPERHTWDGAREAYVAFCDRHGLPVDVRSVKLGFARKPG